MSKWYSIDIVARTTVLVEVEDNEGESEAQEAALEEAFGMADDKETEETRLIQPKLLECEKRHADEILYLPKSILGEAQ